MADSHPFSNAGLGMFGAGESGAKAAMQQGISAGINKNKNDLLGGALSSLLKSFGVGQEDAQTTSGVAPPLPSSQSYQGIAPNYGMGNLPSTGVNPNGMGQYVAPNFAQPQQAAPTQQNDENYISSFKLPRL